MRWKSHVRFGGRAGETDQPKGSHRAPVRPYWATTALDEVRRTEWNVLRQAGAAKAAKQFKGLRFLLRRNWEHLTMGQREVITALEKANRRTFRAWQLN